MKKPKPLLKASLRNKLCLCGSGKKAKKCHPRGIA
nr:SEC-C metal-binding domain-containing protein [Vibrio sp. Isolate30]